MRTTAIGVVLGLAGALVLTRYLQSLLFGVGACDLPVYARVTLLLLLVALTACYLPAPGPHLAPTVALRSDRRCTAWSP
jgi:putative ABC transport system permease protein